MKTVESLIGDHNDCNSGLCRVDSYFSWIVGFSEKWHQAEIYENMCAANKKQLQRMKTSDIPEGVLTFNNAQIGF